MRVVLTVVSPLVALVVIALIAKTQLHATQPLLSSMHAASDAASGPVDLSQLAAAQASAASGADPTPVQQKAFMDQLSKVMQQKGAPNETDGK